MISVIINIWTQLCPQGGLFMDDRKHHTGFTLAEVLITLGIIGIVAALTIPNLIANHRKKVVETRMAKFYSVINQAIRHSEVDNGSVKYWEPLTSEYIKDESGQSTQEVYATNTLEWYNKYLKPYLNVQKIEEKINYDSKLMLYFNDGSALLFSKNSWLFYPEAKSYSEVEKESSVIDRKREDCGTKYFTFYFSQDYRGGGVNAYGAESNLSDETIRTDATLGCKAESVSNERAYCTLLIARNGWKIPKDYPLKF